MGRVKKYHFLFLIAFLFSVKNIAQPYQFKIWPGNLGGAIYKQDFGLGGKNDGVAGAPLPAGITGFSYNNSICPPPGSYSIVQKVNPKNCYDGKWLLVSLDHQQQTFGNMMLVHNVASSSERTVYVDTLTQDLCANTTYEFSAAIINVDALASCSPGPDDYPIFRFSLEDASGTVLQSYTTPEISAAARGTSAGGLWKFSIYGLDYTIPVNMNKITLKITLLRSNTYDNCNNDFAIDDILFSPAGPPSQINFNAMDSSTLVVAACFQANKSFSISGRTDPFYTNPAYQWEQSTDSGLTWKDVPGAMTTTYTRNFPVADTFLFRMRTSDNTTINKPACGVVSNILKIEIDGIPSDIKISSNSPVCIGSNLQFNASGGASYEWFGPNGFYDNVSYSHIYHSTLADSGLYYVQIKTFGGCVKTDSLDVKILATEAITAGTSQSICKGRTVQLNATGGKDYSWSPVTGLSNPAISDPKATPDVTTNYIVTATNEFGCSDTASVKITILNSIPVKALISGPAYLCRPSDSALFKDASTGKIALWNWDFGNGMKSFSEAPQVQNYFIETNAIDYTVHLIVVDSVGCADTAFHTLKVENNCYIAVPSAFTPNGDGLNDYLYPLNAYKATNLSFRVYNRMGQLIFETNDWTKKWDGTFKGEPQAQGVYVWILKYVDENNKNVSLKGSTMLMR